MCEADSVGSPCPSARAAEPSSEMVARTSASTLRSAEGRSETVTVVTGVVVLVVWRDGGVTFVLQDSHAAAARPSGGVAFGPMSNGALKTSPCTTGMWRSAPRWPTSVVGRCPSSTPAAVSSPSTLPCERQSASSTCRTSERPACAVPGAKDFVNACLANDLNRIENRQGSVHLVLQRLWWRHRRSHRLPAQRRRRVPDPNAANTAAVVERLQAAAPEGIVRSRTSMTTTASSPCRGPRATSCCARSGCQWATTTCPSWRDGVAGAPGHRLPDRVHRERGYELVPAWRSPRSCGMPCSRPRHRSRTAVRARRPRHASHRDGLCPARQRAQPGDHPRAGRVGWAVGWKKDAFWGKEALVAEKAEGPRRVSWGLVATGRGIPRAHCAVRSAAGEELGEVTSGTFSPTLRQGIAWRCWRRRSPRVTRWSSTFRGREVPARVVRPPFVEVGVRDGLTAAPTSAHPAPTSAHQSPPGAGRGRVFGARQ